MMVPLRLHLGGFVLVATLIVELDVSSGQSVKPPSQPNSTDVERVIKQFDFDERSRGNLESIPMLWEHLRGPGFPKYTGGEFDFKVGFSAPPSFYLHSNGRNCAYRYTGPDIEVVPGSDYRIAARIRPRRLRNARAYISAFLIDADGERIEGTERRSRLIGGDSAQQDWETVSVRLPGGVGAAYSIGLSVWAVQQDYWWTGEKPVRHIEQRDVEGAAWFDDIVVYRLPSIDLSSSAAERGHWYAFEEPPVLLLQVGDTTRRGLQADLVVRDAAGHAVHRERIDHSDSLRGPTRQIEVPGLTPGIYHAHLNIQLERGAEIDRYLTFLKLPPYPRSSGRSGSRLGVVVDSTPSDERPAHEGLLEALRVANVKLPLDHEWIAGSEASGIGFREFVRRLTDRNLSVVGTFADTSFSGAQNALGVAESVIDLLSKEADTWQPTIATAVTQYESEIKHWQIGTDMNSELFGDGRLKSVLANLRAEMSRLTALPSLVAPWSVEDDITTEPVAANILSVSVPATVGPSEIPGLLDAQFHKAGYDDLWAFVEVPSERRYRRLPRLADCCKRLVFALQSRVDRVFVAQPWQARVSPGNAIVEPNELLPIYRTLISLIDDAVYVGELPIEGRAVCHAFDRHGEAVLVLWDDHSPMQGRPYSVYLHGADRLVDMWGNELELAKHDDSAAVLLSPLPVFLFPAETWLVRFRQGLRFDPILLPSETTFHTQTVLIQNPRNEPISGSIKFKTPNGWQIRPAQFGFAIQPGETFSQQVAIQPAPREPAGYKQIETKVTLDASKLYQFEAHLPLKLDLEDMDVWVELAIEGDTVVVRHGVTNRSNEVVTFRSSADAPGYKRQNLNIIGLQPNQSVIKSHRFQQAGDLSGKTIRVGLKQVKGPRSHNLVIAVP